MQLPDPHAATGAGTTAEARATTGTGGPRNPDPEAAELRQDARRLQDSLYDLVRVIQFRDRDRACCHGVTVSQCYGLKALVDDGPLSVNDLAARLYLDKSTASRLARDLTDEGLAHRARDPRDGRRVLLEATAGGRRLLERIEDDLTDEYAGLLADFDPAVRGAMSELVELLARSFAGRVDAGGGTCCVVRE